MRLQRLQVSGLLLVAALFLLGGCGSSNSSSSAAQTTITGSVFAAPVAGAKVVVLNSTGTTTIAGPVTTLSDGSYSVNIPNSALASDLIISANSGTFTDEATETDVPSGRLTAYVAGGRLAAGSAVHLDPSSTIIHDLMTSGSGTSATAAEALFNTAFGFTPDVAIAPMNTAATGTNAPNRLAAFRAGAFSQLVKDLGFSPAQQFDLLHALALDLADDGILNGSAGSVDGTGIPEDIQNKFEQSLISYMTNTTGNHTGLTPSDIGSLPFAKVALTPTFRVEFIPVEMAKVGKTQFTIKITLHDASPVVGLVLSGDLELMPLMHMSTMNHATPIDDITDNGDGTYSCTAYYLMESGTGMGFWEMTVMINNGMSMESATFHPAVGMAMGTDTVRVTLNGTTDMATSMTNTMGSKRSYFLFNDGVISGMTSTFNVFIATMESMMNMPAVSGGTILTSPTGTWAVDPGTSSLKASLDNTFPGGSTVTAVDNGNGHWSLPGLGLSSSMTSTVYVQFTVNSEIKTAGTSSVSPAYGTFAIAPAM